MRVYFDEDTMSRALVVATRRQGFDVMTSREAGMDGSSDEEQLTFATGAGRLLITTNRDDFARISAVWLRTGRSHAGLAILTRQDIDVGVVLRALERIRHRGSSLDDIVEFI